jgi:hypothetical protein
MLVQFQSFVIFLDFRESIVWHVGPFIGNYREISNYTKTVARQRIRKQI